MEIINIRRSVREYLDKKVEDDKIELILKAAMQAPSACNQQGTRFLVITDKALLEKISERFQSMRFAKNASFVILFLMVKENLIAQVMAPQDASACVENSLIEATNLGIGSCWCGVYPREQRVSDAIELFNIPYDLEPFAIVTYGYPKNSDALKVIDRFDKEKVYYNTFDKE